MEPAPLVVKFRELLLSKSGVAQAFGELEGENTTSQFLLETSLETF